MKLQDLRDRLSRSLWFIPGIMLLASVLMAIGVMALDYSLQDAELPLIAFAGSPEAARSVLSTIAGSVLTITGVVFSITVLVLQLASSQFSPRALRTFLRDRSSKVALGTLLGTFAFSITALAAVRSEEYSRFVPGFTVSLALLLVFASLVMLLQFINHTANTIQVTSIIKSIGEETIEVMGRMLPDEPDRERSAESDDVPPLPYEIKSVHTGVVISVDARGIAELAAKHDVVAALHPRVGWFVADDSVLLHTSAEVDEGLRARLLRKIGIGTERTLEQDIEYGFRELTDIALRALSPALNDPTTAINVIDAEHDLLRRIGRRGAASERYYDSDRRLRFVMQTTPWRDYLRMPFEEIGAAGSDFPTVRTRLAAVARDLIEYLPAERARDVEQVAARWLREQAG